jgi:3-oxoacyl-[acyl-carrier-protein] synthase-1
MTDPVIGIVGASCVLPSGPSLPLADAALRVQLALPRRHPTWVDRCGFPVKAICFHEPAFGFDERRWCALAELALAELADTLDASGVPRNAPIPLWLVLPRQARGGVPSGLVEALVDTVSCGRFDWTQITTVHGEHAVGVHALRQAADAVKRSDTLAAVLAVDSWLHPNALNLLEEAHLLHGAHSRVGRSPRPNPYGRVPGEGAAAVVLGPGARSRALAGSRGPLAPWSSLPWAWLSAATLAEEEVPASSAEPCIAMGLTQAAQAALRASGIGAGLVGRVSTDFNGEPYRADEFGFITLRLAEALAPGWKRTEPALVSGDLGAASAISQLALAAYRMRARPEPHHGESGSARHLILCSSDDPLRAAMVLDAVDPSAAAARSTP